MAEHTLFWHCFDTVWPCLPFARPFDWVLLSSGPCFTEFWTLVTEFWTCFTEVRTIFTEFRTHI